MQSAIIIPCYNEEQRLPIERFIAFYNSSNTTTFCFVNDGSTDNTAQLIQDLRQGREDRILFINRNNNLGKAESVREGFLFLDQMNKYEWVGFFDADLATPLEESLIMLEIAEKHPNVKIIMGTRFRRLGANIERSFSRFLIGRAFATIVSISLHLPVYDTQCGAKLFHKSICKQLFSEPFISKWLFDVEMLFRTIKLLGLKKTKDIVFESPLSEWHEVKNSKLKLKDYLRIPLELLKINTFYRQKK